MPMQENATIVVSNIKQLMVTVWLLILECRPFIAQNEQMTPAYNKEIQLLFLNLLGNKGQ